MAEVIDFQDQKTKKTAQGIMALFGLEFPKDFDKFREIFLRFSNLERGTFDQLIDVLIEAFPEKRENILNFPIYVEIDGVLKKTKY